MKPRFDVTYNNYTNTFGDWDIVVTPHCDTNSYSWYAIAKCTNGNMTHWYSEGFTTFSEFSKIIFNVVDELGYL
jgi:hypothetical protein